MRIILFIALLFPFLAWSDDINEYRYYANNGSYVAYIKKNDNCIYAGYIKDNDIHKYCEMDKSGLNLKQGYPSIYVSRFSLFAPSLDVLVAAPWNEQKCRIDLYENSITCEPTGK